MSWKCLLTCGMIAVSCGFAISLLQYGSLDLTSAPYVRPEPGTPLLEGDYFLRSVRGEKIDLRAPEGGAVVVVLYSADRQESLAPLSTLDVIGQRFPRNQVVPIAICVDPQLDARSILASDSSYSVVHDPYGIAARWLTARTISESFVLVGNGRLLFQGPLSELESAVRAALDGREPAPSSISASIPEEPLPSFAEAPKPPTYFRDVEPILRRSCRECHQSGQSAPFALTSYDNAKKRSADLADVVEQRLMPPWKPTSGVGPPLLHDRTLLESEIVTLRAWADAGAPEGSPGDAPPQALSRENLTGEWALGVPDLVLEMPEEFEIPATGRDVYRCFVLPTNLLEAKSITAIEVQPGNRRVVHHTFGYIDVRGLGRERDQKDPGSGYMCFSGFTGDSIFGALGGWTPGNEAHFFGEGIGLNLPPGADVVVQIHYHPSGRVERDRTRLGLHFAKTPIRQALQWVSACADPQRFVLPAGESEIVWQAELKLPMEVDLHAMTPHMHMLGTRIEAYLDFPDGPSRPLIRIDNWDFNRQDTYYLREPLRLPEGSVVRIRGTFNNSDANPRNPSQPAQTVRWGEGTTDDMMIVFLALTQTGQDLTVPGSTDTFMDDFFRRAGIASEKSPHDGRDFLLSPALVPSNR